MKFFPWLILLRLEDERASSKILVLSKLLQSYSDRLVGSFDDFINNMTAEDLNGSDVEYVEWAGEYKLLKRLNERMSALKSIKHVTA